MLILGETLDLVSRYTGRVLDQKWVRRSRTCERIAVSGVYWVGVFEADVTSWGDTIF